MSDIDYLVLNYPFIRYILTTIVVCRLVFKPIFMILGKYVELTVENSDNKKLERIMNSKAYKLTAFIVDMLASVKLPKYKKGKK